MLLFWELIGSKVIDWCNMGYMDLCLLFVYVWYIFGCFLLYLFQSCFKLVFLRKAIIGCKLLKISLKLLSMLIMCQCLFIISFIFCCTGFYVNENGIVSWRLGLGCFKSNNLSRCSVLSTCLLTVDSL